MLHAYAAVINCHPASSLVCGGLVNTFNNMDDFLSNGVVLQVLPALIGAFVGAPVLALELETGTFRTPGPRASAGCAGPSPSWSCSRSRWRPPPEPSAC